MDYNLATLLNSAQGVLIGVGFAVVIFRLLTLRPGWLTRRLLDATCVDLGRLTRRPLAQAENWFGGRMADRLLRLARHANLLPEQERRRWDDGLLALDLGNELIPPAGLPGRRPWRPAQGARPLPRGTGRTA
ncbi:FUSC family protein [Pseudomonas aeruginosa]